MQMRLVLIPNWVEDALKAANKPLTVALDVCELTNTLSKEDVAIYIDLNDRVLNKLYTPVAETMLPYGPYPTESQTTHRGERVDQLAMYVAQKLADLRIEFPAPTAPISKLVSNVPALDDGEQMVGAFANQYTFEIFPLKEDVLGLRPVLRKSDESDVEEDVRAYSELLKQLNAYVSFEELAATPAFAHYTRLLRNSPL